MIALEQLIEPTEDHQDPMAIKLEYSTIAKCRPEHVWQKFEKLEEWAWWNPVIGQARWLEGSRWAKGGRFLFQLTRPRMMTFKPVIIESDPPQRIAWVGTATGFKGEHWFAFEAQPDGTTSIKTWEFLSGPLTLFMGKGTEKDIVGSYEQWLEALKFEAEKIAREEYAKS
jgi:hypothetical protein